MRWRAGLLAFAATMLTLPASASLDIPNEPLTTGARVPPNVLFLLDDSGSMSWDAMPAGSTSSTWTTRTYVHNAVYYNPAKDYQPWVGADGNALTGGTSYDAVYGSFNLVGGSTINLGSASSCRRYNRNQSETSDEFTSGGTEVCGGVQTFYVPKNPSSTSSTYLGNEDNFYRYQILTDGRVIRSERLVRSGSAPNYNNGPVLNAGCTSTGSGVTWRNCTQVTPGGRSEAAERQNYATWFSYHRTRMKAAKAGASAAFNEIGSNVRVGFRTIWQRNGSQTSGNWPRQAVPIPVQYNDGLFEDVTVGSTNFDNRTKWYSRLHGALGYNGTPLHGALHQAGLYFSSTGESGPYGPQAADEQLACRQNFTILTTDGYWNDFTNYPSGNRVGNADGASSAAITEPSTGASYTYTAGPPYSDGHGGTIGTLADVAMHYWKTDLRPTMRNIVPTTSANPAFWQHMVTFGLSIGLSGSTGFRSVNDVPANYTGWPDPMATENATRIDDLLHAAVNSRGTFVAASDPDEFTAGLKAALAAIVERTGSFSNVAANSTSLDAGARVFQANYVSSVWTGELRSQPVSVSGGVQSVDCSGDSQPGNGWCASKGIPETGRNVYTNDKHFDGSTVNAFSGSQVPRQFPSNATAAQLQALTRSGPLSVPVTGAANAAYIAGARTLEMSRPDGFLRNRNHLLGDIVGSSPAYSEDTDTVYVGANDGMLHAIDASNGRELFAYIPGIINWRDLASLSRPDYAHRYFVDGPIVVSTQQQTPGKNILVGALGKGGRGLFALDVSAPGSFGLGNNVKWERAETPSGNMGLVQGRPVLASVRNGAETTQTAVVFGNGVNSASGRAALIVMNLETGAVIREIVVGEAGIANGLSAPAGVLGPDGKTLAYMYAGDMQGNVWKFDMTASSPDAWIATRLFAASAGGVAQPISGAPAISVNPQTNQRWVFFGTGRYMTEGDVSNTEVQSLYGIVDDGTSILRSGTGANLTRRTVEVNAGVGGYPVRGFETHGALPHGSKGWFIDLPVRGERIVQDAQTVATFLITASIIPSGDACESGGRGFINALDAFTGTSAGSSYFDLDNDGDTEDEVVGSNPRPIGSVDVGGGMPTLPNLLRGRFVVGGSEGSDVRGTRTIAPRWERASWREIRQE